MLQTPNSNRDVVVVGRACRLPGASSVDELWRNLLAARCSVREIPADRWSLDRHGHPRLREAGKSYIWSAGTIDDIWSFDPSVFGVSPREVEQMDPQQRLLLELTWEALEDAGIRRSDVAGTEVGVFVGASSTEYQTLRNADIAGADGYSATGGALSIVSNRISYIFDFRGPSMTVDTACSSSLVALNQALSALRAGTIDTAIVAGVNVLLSPYGFVLFSQASMLSPEGLCRTFDAKADGYVRAEGGVVLVLRTAARAARENNPVHGRIVAAGVNSDGRTNGIALPSRNSQKQLLEDVYRRAGIDPARLAFVEAHGTGTRVGDPIEASVIGEVLGQRRPSPLLVGSIKSNIGHLEPGSGLAGVLKALLALEHDLLPPSINFDEPNPDIAFDDLNISVCASATPLTRDEGPRYAGVNSFGFGGTNAHVIVSDAPRPVARQVSTAYSSNLFALSAATEPALRNLARRYAERLGSASFDEAREVVAAAAHQREFLAKRAIVTWNSPRDLIRKLERIAEKETELPEVVWGTVTETNAPVAFVFSGNGAQWPGMGRDAYQGSRSFRESFDEIDAIFDAKFGWSVTEALFAPDLAERLRFTHVAQPLIFAIQVSVARALRAQGLEPFCVVGHSVGEIAAATVAGALSLQEAVTVIQARSHRQEVARDLGRMAVVVAGRDQVEALCQEIGDVTIAAENAARAFTVAGPTEAIARLGKLAHRRRIVFRQLDLDYPFHCRLVDAVRQPILADLAGLAGSRPNVRMISTVTGELVTGPLGANYWWRNIREPVRFSTAIDGAAQLGARIFVEIGPRSILLSNMKETLEATGLPCTTMGVLERSETERGEAADPIRPAVLSAVTRGADVALDVLFGPKPPSTVPLPTYPWARRDFRHAETGEVVGSTMDRRWHALLGSRSTPDGLDWSRLLDSTLLPELADHEVGGQAILPGAAFVEIALAAAREWLDCERPELFEFDITQALPVEKDRTRELKVRISPSTSTVEILSRPRLTRGGWTSHAVGQFARGRERASEEPVDLPAVNERIGEQAIYAAAESVGLRYGPAFRLLRSAARIGERTLRVDLQPTDAADPRYGIDPARLDACFHGLFALFGELGARRRGTAYIPVRFGQVRIDRENATLAGAIIEIRRAGTGSILADFILLDEGNRRIGHLLDARFQAARVERASTLAEKALVAESVAIDVGSVGEAGLPVTTADLLRAASPWLGRDEADLRSNDQLLLEGWASAAGLAIARRVAGETGEVTFDRLSSLSAQSRAWLINILRGLESSELAGETSSGWSLADPDSLPAPDTILRTLASDHPERSTELLLAGRAGAWMPEDGHAADDAWFSATALDGYDLGGISTRAAGETILRLLADSKVLQRESGLRVLQVGFGPLSFDLARVTRDAEARLTVLDLDPRRIERARLALEGGHLVFVSDPATLPDRGFDLIVSAEGLHRFMRDGGGLPALHGLLASSGLLVAVEPVPSLFRDVVLGLSPGWFGEGAAQPHGPLLMPGEWTRDLEASGFRGVSSLALKTAAEEATLLLAEAGNHDALPAAAPRAIVIQAAPRKDGFDLPDRLATLLDVDGEDVTRTELGGAVETPLPAGGIVVAFLHPSAAQGSVTALREGALALIAAAELCPRSKGELWAVIRADGPAAPIATGLAAFARTLANENATLTIRRIVIEGALDATSAAAALHMLLRNPQTETDIVVGPAGTRTLRFVGLADARGKATTGRSPAGAMMLERGSAGGLSGLGWRPSEPPKPKPGEVEIAVEATGLNFRDVMWAMSLLPDDILEDGFAGPTLGLECAGEVTRIGAEVSRFRPGDRVLAFAPSAFSTSVAVPENVVMPVPSGWRTEAAAGVPVAFLTAYYGLVTLGRLKAGDWVLIHGAAGGVGLAAIQIAQWRGATIVATAGSPEKRDLLRALGVEHVLDSRSTAFAEDIRGLRREGVDVVLNSLFGEAMERSIATLKPFGRFIELGKRDYVANTRIGLRPFKRNLSYFGVDVDQLLSDRDRASEIFAELMRLFEAGDLSPLPYRVFGEDETLDAFRLMQQSGHIGKILLRPPRQSEPLREEPSFRFDPDRTHLVTGGFGGFGQEAARWLADQGVRHLALLGRSGAGSEEAKALVEELEGRGISVAALACDIANAKAVRAALETLRSAMPPLAGILHGAMVLEDGLTANLTADQLTRVLAPKVAGADNLDRLTAEMPLDYFVMFSSITTFIGNPGQGAYVAANGYLEGLARQRRAKGLPGLALAWGAISDVGVLARKKGLAEALAKRVGVVGMPAREALGLMAEALALEKLGGPNTMAVGSLDWSAAQRLPALSSPTFAALTREGGAADPAERQAIDLRLLIAAEEPETVRKRVAEVIVEEIAAVLRVPKQDVGPTKRLGELGLDSLMAIELASALQERLGLDDPPSGSVAAMTTFGLADQLISLASSGQTDEEARAALALNERHVGGQLDTAAIAPAIRAVAERSRDLKGLMQ